MSEQRMEEAGQALSYTTLVKGLLLFLVPLFVPALLMNVLYYTFQMSIEIVLMVTVMAGSMGMSIAYMYYHKIGDELHGKKALVLTFREGRGKVWADFPVIKSMLPISKKMARLVTKALTESKNTKKLSKPKNPGVLVPYEYTFDNFAPFERLILIQPCKGEDLLEFTPQPIIYKGLFVNASVASIDVTKVGELNIEGERIPIAIPTGCDYITEHVQADAKAFSVTKGEIDNIIGAYDGFRCIELKQLLVSKEAELKSALKALDDFDSAVERRAAAKIRHFKATDEEERRVPRFLKIKRTWVVFGLFIGLAVLLWLMVRGV